MALRLGGRKRFKSLVDYGFGQHSQFCRIEGKMLELGLHKRGYGHRLLQISLALRAITVWPL